MMDKPPKKRRISQVCLIALLAVFATGNLYGEELMNKGNFVLTNEEAPYAMLTFPPSSNELNFASRDGRTATINFGGEYLTYSGDLPVDESAKMFFEAYRGLIVIESDK